MYNPEQLSVSNLGSQNVEQVTTLDRLLVLPRSLYDTFDLSCQPVEFREKNVFMLYSIRAPTTVNIRLESVV